MENAFAVTSSDGVLACYSFSIEVCFSELSLLTLKRFVMFIGHRRISAVEKTICRGKECFKLQLSQTRRSAFCARKTKGVEARYFLK